MRLRVRPDTCGRRCVSIGGSEFVSRLLQHVLPPGFKRIRHYGRLAPAAKRPRLAAARRLLQMPQPDPVAQEDAMPSCAGSRPWRWALSTVRHWALATGV